MVATIPPELTSDDEDVIEAQLIAVSEANPGWKVEREADGSFVMCPGGVITSTRHIALLAVLFTWNGQPPRGRLFDASAGFTMPDGAILSPDAAWMTHERWNAFTPQQLDSFTHVVPDVCIEVRSKRDRPSALRRKLLRYRAYGAGYVVLIDPYRRTTWTDGTAPDGFPTDFTSVFDDSSGAFSRPTSRPRPKTAPRR